MEYMIVSCEVETNVLKTFDNSFSGINPKFPYIYVIYI